MMSMRFWVLGILIACPGGLAWAQLSQDSLHDQQTAVAQRLAEEGDAWYGRGKMCMWTGAALLPVSLIAFIPVMYDGAFGITAADPGFGILFAAAGVGLIQLGIPLLGWGADKTKAAEHVGNPQTGGHDERDWEMYAQSWRVMGAGAGLTALSLPFGILAALSLDRPNAAIGNTAIVLMASGLTVAGAGLIEQEYSGYLFMRRHGRAKAALRALSALTVNPLLLVSGSRIPAAGLRIATRF